MSFFVVFKLFCESQIDIESTIQLAWARDGSRNLTAKVEILTSNIGSQYLLEQTEESQELVQMALRQHFKPELLNRMDDIIMFHALSDEHFHAIAWKYVHQLQARVAEQEITLKVDDTVVEWVVKHGIDPQFGARPLKRFVQRHLETLVARELLKGDVVAGESLTMTLENETLVIRQQ